MIALIKDEDDWFLISTGKLWRGLFCKHKNMNVTEDDFRHTEYICSYCEAKATKLKPLIYLYD